MGYCIVNADDFGLSPGVTRGIVEAHLRGIVTSTSMMVNTPFSGDAAQLRQAVPELSIGLHVNLTNEDGVPIVDFDQPEVCAAELDRQMRLFEELMGGRPTHLDSHHNIHRDARLLSLFQRLAERHGLPLRGHSPARYFPSFYGQWDGETHLEQISVASLAHMLASEFDGGCTELSCHPGYVDEHLHSIYAVEREEELRTLCDPAIRRTLAELRLELIGFRDLRRALALTQQ